ncbi:MAG TPA: hypothetical protein DCL38_06585 [Lachnospiraceae bacterium]|nr:hypothetical protein [Lachnospiraceae bacterium]
MKESLKNNILNDEELNAVSGGFLFNASGIQGSDPNHPWEVIDNTNGNVLGRFSSQQEATIWAVKSFGGMNTDDITQINWDNVQRLRSGYAIIR